MNYQNGKIYKIVSDNTDKIYIGSTCSPLSKRLYQHKNAFNNQKAGRRIVTSIKLLELGEVDIILIENFPCNNKNELHARERFWIEQNKETVVNRNIPNRTQKEYRHDNKEIIAQQMKQYRQDNKEKIAKQSKQYREDNKEKIQQYWEDNKNRTQQYRKDNKEKLQEWQRKLINCECGSQFTNSNKVRHLKTEMHQRFAKSNNIINEIKDINKVCECGMTFSIGNKNRHNKSAKHQAYLSSLELNKE